MADRRGLFKNADKDFASSRRNRQDHSVEIRKVKKEDNLQKRRQINMSDLEDSPTKENAHPINALTTANICKMMKGNNVSEQLEAVVACRKKLSKEKNPPINDFCKNGAIDALVKIIKSSKDETMLFEALWAITNIASGEGKHTAAVVASGVTPLLITFMDHKVKEICEQSIWVLGNIVGDSAEFRDLTIKAGITAAIIKCLHRFAPSKDISVLRQVIWLISNICRHKKGKFPKSDVITLLPYIRELLTSNTDITCLTDVSWALVYTTDCDTSVIDAMISLQILPLVNNNLSAVDAVAIPSIRVLGNIVSSSDEHTNAAIAAGVVQSTVSLLNNGNSRIVKEACWLLSNICAGTVDQINYLIECNAVPSILRVMLEGDFRCQKEASWAVSNLCASPESSGRLCLLNNDVFRCLVPMLGCDDSKIVLNMLDVTKSLLEVAEGFNQLDECVGLMEAAGVTELIERLQEHKSEEVYQASHDLVSTYFDCEGDEEEAVAEGEKFAF